MKSRTKKFIFRRDFTGIRWNVHCSTWWGVGNDESYAHDFFKAHERQRARGGLLTIPAEHESVRGGPRATMRMARGPIRGVVTARVAMAVRRAIGDMSTRPLVHTRCVKKEPR
jgi:hypothetical protein